MKKYIFILSFVSAIAFAQQPVEITYDTINRAFQAELQKLFQNFTDSQASQGNEVIVAFYDNQGEVRASTSTAGTPPYLAISNYKVNFMKSRQLTSTKGVFYFGSAPDFFSAP